MSFVEAEKLRQLLRMKLLYSGSMSTTILCLLLESTASKQVKSQERGRRLYVDYTRFWLYCQEVKAKFVSRKRSFEFLVLSFELEAPVR